jgi:hypothetical protein
MAIRRSAVALAVTAAVLAAALAAGAPAGAQGSVRYVPPVDAPVVDPFRPPASAFAAGNRGLTYDVAPGSPVRASAAGEVTFAGTVAGTLHVTVLHPDGLRTSYSFLESVAVRRGQRVAQGDVVGSGGAGFHLGVRSGDTYLDPAALFGGVEVRVRLVPHEEPLPPTDAGLLRERIALLETVRERSRLERLRAFVARNGRRALELVGAGLELHNQMDPWTIAAESVVTLRARIREYVLRECTPGDQALPDVDAGGRIALLVGGLSSTSTEAAVDGMHLDEVGYEPGDVLRYSYRGGRVPDPDGRLHPGLAGIPARPYAAADTWDDLVGHGRALADLVEDVASARPGAPIDLYAHSQGGIVARLALLELARRPGGLDALGAVVTMGTPHDGADIATGAQLLHHTDRQSVEFVAGLVGAEIDTDAVSVQQLSERSALIAQLQVSGVPDGVDLRTIGARGDLVVTGDKTTVDGHPAAMLDLVGPAAHGDIPASSGTTRELRLALAGLPPQCGGIVDMVLDSVVPEAVSWGENAAIGALIGA